MDISILIPQLFYDVIGRIVPGATLLTSTLILFEGPKCALHHLGTWSEDSNGAGIPTVLIILGNLLASHILASLIGGIWFRLYRVKYGWAGRGEREMERKLKQSLNVSDFSQKYMSKMKTTTEKIACMYDYVLLQCPKAGARIAKLRAEQHMSGVLMIGYLLLAACCNWFPYMKDQEFFVRVVVEVLLIWAAISAALLAWHLEKRSGSALYNLCLLASKDVKEN
jgi:hypothetical protein